jgi:hypothetical protein
MKKRLFAALRWIETSHKNPPSKVAEQSPDQDLDAEFDAWELPENPDILAYTQADLSTRMGTEEWYLAFEMDSNGVIRSEDSETTTYSLSLSPEGIVQIRLYDMQWNSRARGEGIGGKYVTVETDSRTGTWQIAERVLTLHLPDETWEFIVARIEGGVAILVDTDDGSVSGLMTQAALNAELDSAL